VDARSIPDLRSLLEDHLRYTGSSNAERVLANWDEMLPKFVKVMPRDFKRVLAERGLREQEETAAVAG